MGNVNLQKVQICGSEGSENLLKSMSIINKINIIRYEPY